MTIRIADVESESIVDGPGFRFAVYTQGCPHACPGCHNPQTHPFEGGKLMEAEDLSAMVAKSPFNKGVTLSGGEPMCQAAELVPFARAMRESGKSIWIYSGYTYEQLTGRNPMGEGVAEFVNLSDAAKLLELADVLVDGRFVQSLSSYDAKWRGSTNQRVIDLNKTRESGEIVILEGTAKAETPRSNRERWS